MAQQKYIKHYCNTLFKGLASIRNGEIVINMDEVADATGKDGEKPRFYISDESQQCKFTCEACGEFNDILGRHGYCSLCLTRNDLSDFEKGTVVTIRKNLNSDKAPEDCLRDTVAAFDSFMKQISKQLLSLMPMTEYRKSELKKLLFHNLTKATKIYKEWFDFDLTKRLSPAEVGFVQKMLSRRHVYEHNGGIIDEKYIEDKNNIA